MTCLAMGGPSPSGIDASRSSICTTASGVSAMRCRYVTVPSIVRRGRGVGSSSGSGAAGGAAGGGAGGAGVGGAVGAAGGAAGGAGDGRPPVQAVRPSSASAASRRSAPTALRTLREQVADLLEVRLGRRGRRRHDELLPE